MSTVACPHCNAANESTSSFCAACGKALPAGMPASPRIVDKQGWAASTAGLTLQADQLKAETKKAFGALLAVAILQTIGAVVFPLLMKSQLEKTDVEVDTAFVSVIMFGLAAVFYGLAFWARKNPFPAAIVGLVLFVSVHLLDAIADPSSLIRGILVKIIVIAVLIRAVSAGSRYRKLVGQAQGV